MPFREKDLDLETLLWNKDVHTLAPLLAVSSHADASAEPRWLALCDYLALAFRQGESAKPSKGWDERALQELADQIWGAEALSAEELAQAWFALPDDVEGQPPHWLTCQESAHRAVAIAELAGLRYGWRNDRIDPGAWLTAQEQKALKQFWANRYGPEDSLRMPVLLVNQSAAVGEKGRRAQLRFYAVNVEPALHGQLLRAPAAAMLSLQDRGNAAFAGGLEKVTTLLKACLKPALAGEQGGLALMWSLHPEPMVVERDAGAALQAWGTQPITGASATAAFAIGALWLLRSELRLDLPGMALAQRHLRAIDPGHLAISAQLEGLAPPDMNNPLKWRLATVNGLDEKLGAFVLDKQWQTNYEKTVTLALVANGQNCKGNQDGSGFELRAAEDLAQALECAYNKVGAPLPEAGEALWRYLLEHAPEGLDRQSADLPLAQPATPIAPRELIDPLRPEFERASDQLPTGMAMASDRGKPNAIAWYLLKSYARWAGGEHVLWGEPARLAEDFYPIELETIAEAGAHGKEAKDPKTEGKLRARSLIELLDPAFLPQQPPVWVLGAPPAAGKTTMLAEFHLHHAFKALTQYALSGHFGVVPVWIPARELVLKDPESGKDRSLDQALAAWFQSALPALGSLPELLRSPLARVQVLLDGINEIRCEPSRRATLLADWVAAHFGPAHGHRPPLLTVRSLELIRPLGARVANLLPWDKGQREAYVRQRLEKFPAYLKSMQASLAADEKAAGEATEKMLYSSPGMLSLACTLMRKGLLPPDPEQRPMNRARLLSTLIWSGLASEGPDGLGNIPVAMLGQEETERLYDLESRLREGDWHPPQAPGPLLAALAEQARHMQFDHAAAEIELPERLWWRGLDGTPLRQVLTRSAGHLGVVQGRRVKDPSGRFGDWLSYRHQLLLEYFSSLGLTPHGPWPANVAAPIMRPVSEDYEQWLTRKKKFTAGVAEKGDLSEAEFQQAVDVYQALSERGSTEPGKHSVGDVDAEVDSVSNHYQLPPTAISVHEETIKLAAQLRGDPVDWVRRLMREGNSPMAARLALQNWSAFGEPVYPQEDCLNPWREDKTHPVLNELRLSLDERMYSKQVHISQRVEAGDLLGQLGGSPLYEICGQALILKDKYWVSIGEEGQLLEIEMGDLEGDADEQTAEGTLYRVRGLQAFRIAGFLVTNAQYWCFAQDPGYETPTWWPGAAKKWLDEQSKNDRAPWNLGRIDIESYGLAPLLGTYWHAQAYALWEQSQRARVGRYRMGWSLKIPTEAHWECGARWAWACAVGEDSKKKEESAYRWRFAHTAGASIVSSPSHQWEEWEYYDIQPWHLNHGSFLVWRSSPVGVFLESNSRYKHWPYDWALRDLAGNEWEWCSSMHHTVDGERLLGEQVERAAQGDECRGIRGGASDSPSSLCRVGVRSFDDPAAFEPMNCFRLMLSVDL